MIEDNINALERKLLRFQALFICCICRGIQPGLSWSDDVREGRSAARDLVGGYCTKRGIAVPGLTPVEWAEEEGDLWFDKFVNGEPWELGCYRYIADSRRICGIFSDTTIRLVVHLLFIAAYLRELEITHIGPHPFEVDYSNILDQLVKDAQEDYPGLRFHNCRCDL